MEMRRRQTKEAMVRAQGVKMQAMRPALPIVAVLARKRGVVVGIEVGQWIASKGDGRGEGQSMQRGNDAGTNRDE